MLNKKSSLGLVAIRMVLMLMSASGAYAVETAGVLTSASINYMGVNATTTGTTAARNIGVIYVTAGTLQNSCQGVWIDVEANKSTYAMLLTAIATQKNINIYYDSAQPSPWGNPAWCALTYASISP